MFSHIHLINPILLSLLITTISTQTLYDFPIIQDSMLSGLTNFTISFMNFSTPTMLLFGGISPSLVLSNTLIQTVPKSSVSSIISPTTQLPPARYNHCAYVDNNKLYIYGGIGINEHHLQDLWEFNYLFSTWVKVADNNVFLTNCHIVRNNNDILIFGIDSTQSSALKISKFSLNLYQWQQQNYTYGYAVVNEGQLWSRTINKTLTTVENLTPTSPISPSSILELTNTFSAPYICILKLPLSSENLNSSYEYLLISDSKILKINLIDMQIMLLYIDPITVTCRCQITSELLLLVSEDQNQIQIKYYQINDFQMNGVNHYPKIKDLSSHQFLVIAQDIYFISQTTFKYFILQKQCQSLANVSNMHSCFYNIIQCNPTHTGPLCQTISCPNTLTLFDQSNFNSIVYECSGHGKCTSQGCVCEGNWTGEDCGTYRRDCSGDLIDNWPLMNCECKQKTQGGNSCKITFCYNDCSNHGSCLDTGKCVCNDGYFGDDCSITIIEFPNAVSSIL